MALGGSKGEKSEGNDENCVHCAASQGGVHKSHPEDRKKETYFQSAVMSTILLRNKRQLVQGHKVRSHILPYHLGVLSYPPIITWDLRGGVIALLHNHKLHKLP